VDQHKDGCIVFNPDATADAQTETHFGTRPQRPYKNTHNENVKMLSSSMPPTGVISLFYRQLAPQNLALGSFIHYVKTALQ
jgi:hypothetical protein